MTPLEILKGARALIATEDRWHKGQYYPDAVGFPNLEEAKSATCLCIHGAIALASDTPFSEVGDSDNITGIVDRELSNSVFHLTLGTNPFMSANVPAFNDHKLTTHKDVLAVIDVTIERLEAEEPERLSRQAAADEAQAAADDKLLRDLDVLGGKA